jgi:two-component system OmpR family response regulator
VGSKGESRELIVVADDDPDIRLLIAHKLQDAGFAVEEAADGLETLRKVNALKPAVLVLDIGMPGLDGHAVMRIVRNHDPSPRVVFVSARATVEDRVAGLELGAVDYVTKPFQTIELVARVKAAARR